MSLYDWYSAGRMERQEKKKKEPDKKEPTPKEKEWKRMYDMARESVISDLKQGRFFRKKGGQ